MLLAGADKGVYRVSGVTDPGDITVRKVLDAPRAERVRHFDAVDGVFAATETGLYYSANGRDWADLHVPEDTVWAVTIAPSGDRIYAGTVPAKVYVSSLPAEGIAAEELEWRELDGFRQLPSRDEWGVPRHNNQGRVRDLCIHPASPNRLIAGVEPGGVHVSTDGGETWTERNDGVHDDIHSLHVVADGELLAATGVGLYRTTDAGRLWTRLDDHVKQRYFRTVYQYEGVVYASAANVPPSAQWETPDADPELFTSQHGTSLEQIDVPCADEVVVGWTTLDEMLIGATHRGTLLKTHGETWEIIGELPSSETIPGCYYNLTPFPQ
ncbi:WD40 repeat domain-containing protein [Halobacterium sp. CBA1126]|uniref:WD40/YVTN/BNR-like repeat-containing protein n=1 Tax=Halobacterium TaxID=2239 RepID=UPI0012F799B4|nr:WD40 repeat domain-containing protein [Halobacterium sp. CBA1126]MUV60038.1 WD40 repeat domain-containing protein [Halobacterium sp. CBA1126]